MDELLAKAGLSASDFHRLVEVEESPVSGRIIVLTGPTLEQQPFVNRNLPNFVCSLVLDGESRHVFNPVS